MNDALVGVSDPSESSCGQREGGSRRVEMLTWSMPRPQKPLTPGSRVVAAPVLSSTTALATLMAQVSGSLRQPPTRTVSDTRSPLNVRCTASRPVVVVISNDSFAGWC